MVLNKRKVFSSRSGGSNTMVHVTVGGGLISNNLVYFRIMFEARMCGCWWNWLLLLPFLPPFPPPWTWAELTGIELTPDWSPKRSCRRVKPCWWSLCRRSQTWWSTCNWWTYWHMWPSPVVSARRLDLSLSTLRFLCWIQTSPGVRLVGGDRSSWMQISANNRVWLCFSWSSANQTSRIERVLQVEKQQKTR